MIRTVEDPRWFQQLEERTQSYLMRWPELAQIHEKLLSIGGEFVILFPCEDVGRMLEKGVLFDAYCVQVIRDREGMLPSHCHQNVGWLWSETDEPYRIATGYALSEDRVWRKHSWAILDDTLFETTTKRTRYFGYILSREEAEEFYHDNF